MASPKLVTPNCHRPEIMTPQSAMLGLINTFAVTAGLSFCIRSIHIPANPTACYKHIQCRVIKDRNPIGKFKCTPSAKGKVTIFITAEGLHHDTSFLTEYPEGYRNIEMKHAFTSHLDNNINYSITVSIRKAKRNINLKFMVDDIINKDYIINNLDKIISWVRGETSKQFNLDLKKYRERLIKASYIKIIFYPRGYMNNYQEDNNNHPLITNNDQSKPSVDASPGDLESIGSTKNSNISTLTKINKRFYSSVTASSHEDSNTDLSIVLPCLHYEWEFKSKLKIVLLGLHLDKNLSYGLKYFLYLNTNDKSKELIRYPKEDSVLSSNEYSGDILTHTLGLMLLDIAYKFKGHYLFHRDIFNPDLVRLGYANHKDLDGYIESVYGILRNIVINTDESLDVDEFVEFVEFKKSTVLKITQIKKSSNTKLNNDSEHGEVVAPKNLDFYCGWVGLRQPASLDLGKTRFKYYSTCSEACFASQDLIEDKKLKNNLFLKRAIYNFIKASVNNQISGVHFQDSTTLITFLKEFDPDFKMSRQSVHNYKKRKLVFKRFLMNTDVSRFFAYVNNRFPEFNLSDFMEKCSGTCQQPVRGLLKFGDYAARSFSWAGSSSGFWPFRSNIPRGEAAQKSTRYYSNKASNKNPTVGGKEARIRLRRAELSKVYKKGFVATFNNFEDWINKIKLELKPEWNKNGAPSHHYLHLIKNKSGIYMLKNNKTKNRFIGMSSNLLTRLLSYSSKSWLEKKRNSIIQKAIHRQDIDGLVRSNVYKLTQETKKTN